MSVSQQSAAIRKVARDNDLNNETSCFDVFGGQLRTDIEEFKCLYSIIERANRNDIVSKVEYIGDGKRMVSYIRNGNQTFLFDIILPILEFADLKDALND